MSESEESAPTGEPNPIEMTPVLAEFGKYQLLAVLGRGGMGDVFLAVSRGPMDFKKLVVIKRLRTEHLDDHRIRSMFLDEGKLAARLNHPQVVQTYEVGTHDGFPYITMEYLEGQALSRVQNQLAKKKANPRLAAYMIAEALSGLHCAHELRDFDGTPLNVVHRDLSPQNIFVTYDGVVKLVDFGIAKTALGSREKTEFGVLKGKIAYMAPEQVASDDVDRRADIFAIGVVLWELIAHRRLMGGKSAAVTLNTLLHAPIPRLSAVVPTIDKKLDDIVAKALERDPDARFQSALAMREALEGYLVSSGAPIRDGDVARVVSEGFDDRRKRVQQQIQACMRAAPKNDLPIISTVSTISSLVPVEHLRADTSNGAPTPPGIAAVGQDEPQPFRGSLRGLLNGRFGPALGAVAAIAIVTLVLAVRGHRDGQVATAAAPVAAPAWGAEPPKPVVASPAEPSAAVVTVAPRRLGATIMAPATPAPAITAEAAPKPKAAVVPAIRRGSVARPAAATVASEPSSPPSVQPASTTTTPQADDLGELRPPVAAPASTPARRKFRTDL